MPGVPFSAPSGPMSLVTAPVLGLTVEFATQGTHLSHHPASREERANDSPGICITFRDLEIDH